MFSAGLSRLGVVQWRSDNSNGRNLGRRFSLESGTRTKCQHLKKLVKSWAAYYLDQNYRTIIKWCSCKKQIMYDLLWDKSQCASTYLRNRRSIIALSTI